MTTTLTGVDPSPENLSKIRTIADPIERAWAAELLRRAAPKNSLRALQADALGVRADAIAEILADYADMQPLDRLGDDDRHKRAWLAEAIRRAANTRAKEQRDRRDRAGLLLLQPFVRAVLPTNIAKKKLRARYQAGKITPTVYYAGLEKLLEKRRKALADANVSIEPADVYKPMGVSRARLIQMIEEVSVEGLPPMRNASQVLESCSREVERLVEIQAECRDARDADLEVLLAENSSAEVARMVDLTTARIAQIRNRIFA